MIKAIWAAIVSFLSALGFIPTLIASEAINILVRLMRGSFANFLLAIALMALVPPTALSLVAHPFFGKTAVMVWPVSLLAWTIWLLRGAERTERDAKASRGKRK